MLSDPHSYRWISLLFTATDLEDLLSHVGQADAPGYVVGVARDKEIVYRKAIGIQSVAAPLPLDTSTRFRIFSLSKHITCAALLAQCNKRKGLLDEPIGTYLSNLPEASLRVTARQLMTHTSGLLDIHDIVYHFSGTGRRLTREDVLALARKFLRSASDPGAAWSYNNSAYLLLSILIETIEGLPLREVLRKRLFDPCGMRNTTLSTTDDELLIDTATLHEVRPGDFLRKGSLGIEATGEGGIVSTLDDLLRWMAQLSQPDFVDLNWGTLGETIDLDSGVNTGYGLGLSVEPYCGQVIFHHGGGGLGGNAYMIHLPNLAIDIIALANTDSISSLSIARSILDLICSRLKSSGGTRTGRSERLAPSSTARPRVYHSPQTGRVLEVHETHFYVNGFRHDLSGEPEGVLRSAAQLDTPSAIRLDPLGPTEIRFSEHGNVDYLELVNDPVVEPALPDICGTYQCRSFETRVEIELTQLRAMMVTQGPFGRVRYDLHPIRGRFWRAAANPASFMHGVLEFSNSNRSFRFSNYRTTGICFDRVQRECDAI